MGIGDKVIIIAEPEKLMSLGIYRDVTGLEAKVTQIMPMGDVEVKGYISGYGDYGDYYYYMNEKDVFKIR